MAAARKCHLISSTKKYFEHNFHRLKGFSMNNYFLKIKKINPPKSIVIWGRSEIDQFNWLNNKHILLKSTAMAGELYKRPASLQMFTQFSCSYNCSSILFAKFDYPVTPQNVSAAQKTARECESGLFVRAVMKELQELP